METAKKNMKGATKRKIETVDGPPMKLRKDESYDLLLINQNEWKIEATEAGEKIQRNLIDSKNYNLQLVDRQVQYSTTV